MNFLKWNQETMGTGVKLIDNQHKDLLKIINKLSTSINNKSQKKDILSIINEFINYADYHFSTEENLFDKFDYCESDSHKKEHSFFLNEFIKLKNEISGDKAYKNKTAIEISEQLFQYIINWFLTHVVGSDKKFVMLFKENGIK